MLMRGSCARLTLDLIVGAWGSEANSSLGIVAGVLSVEALEEARVAVSFVG